MNKKKIIQCINVFKSYKDGKSYKYALKNINFSIKKNEMIIITGNSGSGKSTLLHILGGLDSPTKGEVLFFGKSLKKICCEKFRNKKLGFIYQFHYLLSDFTILENVAMPLMISGMKTSKALYKASLLINKLNLEKKIKNFPYQLSGGEKQKVSIARALVNKPCLILADEPTGNLDLKNSINILNIFKKFQIKKNVTFLVVTHDLNLIKKFSRRLEIQDGKILYDSYF
ncbi:ABC transporter ATP-binding protein [Sodalis-like secondary symbiont of Drepanosiphum platanoidis]|uniref:ABC transporter ATP-binding protein n=1 Tax=Sodalis-like secondary symbiont of Drepanosiphum platanoidis TaxID=2994493 RepID=UPI003464E1C4